MDFNYLFKALNENILTDLELVLDDNKDILVMNVHKIILWSSCDYFRKLFNNFSESNSNKIKLNVYNVYVTYDIIMSFYNKKSQSNILPKWKYDLEMIRCRDFLALEYDLKNIYNLQVPPEHFDFLLEFLPYMENNSDTYLLLKRSIPTDYDRSKLSDQLFELLSNNIYYNLIKIINGDTIELIDFEKNKLINSFISTNVITKYKISIDNEYIALLSQNKITILKFKTFETIKDIDLLDFYIPNYINIGTTIGHIENYYDYKSTEIIFRNNKILFMNNLNVIGSYDIINNNLSMIKLHVEDIYSDSDGENNSLLITNNKRIFSNDGSMIVIALSNQIAAYNTETGIEIFRKNIIFDLYDIKNILLTPTNETIIIICKGFKYSKIIFFDVINKLIHKTIKAIFKNVILCDDSKYYITYTKNGYIIFYDINTFTKFKEININNNISMLQITPDNKYLIYWNKECNQSIIYSIDNNYILNCHQTKIISVYNI